MKNNLLNLSITQLEKEIKTTRNKETQNILRKAIQYKMELEHIKMKQMQLANADFSKLLEEPEQQIVQEKVHSDLPKEHLSNLPNVLEKYKGKMMKDETNVKLMERLNFESNFRGEPKKKSADFDKPYSNSDATMYSAYNSRDQMATLDDDTTVLSSFAGKIDN